MSRFYKALREAERTSAGLPGSGSGEPRNGGGIDHTTAPQDVVEMLEVAGAIAAAAGPRERSGTNSDLVSRERGAPRDEGAPLGVSARVDLDRKARLIPHTADEAIVEHYRRLRAKIIQEQERKPFRTLAVTSPAPKEGKSVTTLNLALSFGMLPSHRVLVVDGDMRKGSLGHWLGIGDHAGFSELIEGTAELEDVVLNCDDFPVSVMVRGRASLPPPELLHSPRLAKQLQRMAEHFSLVLIDTPPVNLMADAQLIAGACDAVLVVARAFYTTRKAIERTVQDLSAFRVIGAVLNRGMKADLFKYYKNYK